MTLICVSTFLLNVFLLRRLSILRYDFFQNSAKADTGWVAFNHQLRLVAVKSNQKFQSKKRSSQ